jgi:hypothetical protein
VLAALPALARAILLLLLLAGLGLPATLLLLAGLLALLLLLTGALIGILFLVHLVSPTVGTKLPTPSCS